MKDSSQIVIELTRKRITRSYRIALSMVAVVILSTAALTSHLLNSHAADSTLINTAGRQLVLLQRIIMLTDETVHLPTDSIERNELLHKLKKTVDEMERSHQLLAHGNEEMGYPTVKSETLNRIYFEQPLLLDKQVCDYLSRVRRVLRPPPADIIMAQPDVNAVVHPSTEKLLEALDAVVKQHKLEDAQHVNTLYYVVLGLSAFAIVLLCAVAVVVLRPAIAYVAQARKRLIELNQLKGDFLANMSHEIRTPMNGIFGMTELLLESTLNQRQEHYVRTLQTSADHLLGLINDILDFSKLEAGQMKLDPIRFNLHATIEDVLDLLSSRAREKNLELLVRYLPGTPRFIVADPGRMRQILFNLTGNAIKFTDKGYVLIHVEMVPRKAAPDARMWLRVRVEDTGIGIPEDKMSGLFEKFMQVETGSTRARQGTGLGLAISRNLIDLMNGTIGVESSMGKGTVFSFQIPLPEAGEPEPAQERNALLTGIKVLLVDDLAPNRTLYSETITAAGMECVTAENAQEALSRLRYEADNNRPVQVVITDYMMPGTNGVDLTRAIRTDETFRDLPVIILSSAGERGLVKAFSDAGASGCLAKPVSRQQLYDTLVHVLEARQKGIMGGIITMETSNALSARRLLSRDKPLYGTHILLVEDNRVNCEITTEMLESLGCRVTSAENGQLAVEATLRQPFDLIFMDCQMPVMDGFEAARHIVTLKAEGKVTPVPIIALTANAMKGDRERCLSSGMDDYLSKPLRKASLEAALLKWLRDKLESLPQVPQASELPASHVVTQPATSVIDALEPAPPPESCGIDEEAFNMAKTMLGAKLSTVISYFLEDSEDYLNRIESALHQNDPASAVLPAHTLKSSSKQFGVTHLSDLARRAEEAARAAVRGENAEDIEPLLSDMRSAFASARPFLAAQHNLKQSA